MVDDGDPQYRSAGACACRTSWRLAAMTLTSLCLVVFAASAWAGDPVAHDVAAEVGLTFHGATISKTQGETPIFDYDGDGDLDIMLSTHGVSPWALMQNQGDDTFVEVLNGTFYKTDRHGCVDGDFGSLNASGRPDGLPDLSCVSGACTGTCKKEYPNSLFIQRSDHTFVDVAKAWGVADSHGRARKPLAFDFNNDGLLDIFVANEGPSIYPPLNRLFKNVRGRFEEVTSSPANTQQHSECAVSGYVDSDKWRDLIICGRVSSGIGTVTYMNVKGSLVDVTASTAYKKLKAIDLKLADVNNDKKQDLLILEANRFSVWLNVNGTYPKMNYKFALKGGRDLAVGDANGDKKLDVFIARGPNNQNQHTMLINNGNGKSYHTIPLPVLSEGSGDTATTFKNWRKSGRDAFLVTNGLWGIAGPVQMIMFSDK